MSPSRKTVMIAVATIALTVSLPSTAMADDEVQNFYGKDVLSQHLVTGDSTEDAPAPMVDTPAGNPETPHGFDVHRAIAAAASEIGTSRATGWSQPGECIMSAKRWIQAGGGQWIGSGDPVSNYLGATRIEVREALPGDIIQYENLTSPTSWVSGVHTLLIVEVNDDGTFQIIESNNPGGSGLVTRNNSWTPQPPAGFQAVAWRF